MGWNTIIYIHLAFRSFLPFTTFMTPYLIDKKKFTNKEVSNSLIPYFFISSTLTSFFGPVLAEIMGKKHTMVLETFLEVLSHVFFYIVPERSFSMAPLAILLHGVSTSLNFFVKSLVYELKPNNVDSKEVNSHILLIKQIMHVGGSLLGQDLKFTTNTYTASLYFSIFMLLVALLFGGFVKNTSQSETHKSFLSSFKTFDFRNLKNKKRSFYLLLYIIGSNLYICLALYAANIFTQRKKDKNVAISRMGKALYLLSYPIRLFSFLSITMMSMIDYTISYSPKYDDNVIIFGYIDGIGKIVSVLAAAAAVKIHSMFHFIKMEIAMGTALSLVFFIYLLGRVESLLYTYIIYILALTLAHLTKVLAQNELVKEKEFINIYLGIVLFASSLLHITVSYVSKWRRSETNVKFYYYFFACGVLIVLALFFGFTNILE